MREGRGRWVVDGVEFEAGAGDILVIKAGEVHECINIGETPLVQVDMSSESAFRAGRSASRVREGLRNSSTRFGRP